eukprot:11414881-Prorocentrum_lima.AAC.1
MACKVKSMHHNSHSIANAKARRTPESMQRGRDACSAIYRTTRVLAKCAHLFAFDFKAASV